MSGNPAYIPESEGLDCLSGGGEMGALLRSLDWSTTPLGPAEKWPQSLRTSLSICLNSRFALLIWWGPELVMLYNDAYRQIIAGKHPAALGRPGRECWHEIWHVIGPMLKGVQESGQATWSDDLLLLLERHGYPEECYFTFSYSPVLDESGKVGGVFTPVTETTEKVIGARRLRTLRDLADRSAEATGGEEACRIAAETLVATPQDIPFALIYLLEADRKKARLVGTAGLGPGTPASPTLVDLTEQGGPASWPLAEVARTGETQEVHALEEKFGRLPGGAWPLPPPSALVLPITLPGHALPEGILVAAASPRKALDREYRGFFDLIAVQVARALAEAIAYEEKEKRANSLAALDRSKTAFFSNVSHEFRTPLTLMMSPLEDLLAVSESELSLEARDQIVLV